MGPTLTFHVVCPRDYVSFLYSTKQKRFSITSRATTCVTLFLRGTIYLQLASRIAGSNGMGLGPVGPAGN